MAPDLCKTAARLHACEVRPEDSGCLFTTTKRLWGSFLYVLGPAGITYVGISSLFHDRNPTLLDQTLEPLDLTLESRDYEGVPWGDEDEDMTSVRVGVEVVGR
jgi:hypothetical protein